MDRGVPQISLKDQRERTVRTLCEHFARDHLEIDEFEARLDAAHRARAQDELELLVRDLPALRPQATPGRPAGADAVGRAVGRARQGLSEAVEDSRTIVAIMSGVERRGQWEPGRKNMVFAAMGGVELDFRDAVLAAGETEVSIFCIMGGVEIIVPPEVRVDASGIAIMGAFEHLTPAPRTEAEGPTLRVQGFCMMGGVEIHVRQPGESAKDARLRRREEARLQRARRRLRGETE